MKTIPSGLQGSPRIVITGIGVVSPIGLCVDSFWAGLTGSTETSVDSTDFQPGEARFKGHIDDFGELPKPLKKSIRKALKLMNRETQMGVAAGQQALSDSGLIGEYESDRIGVCFGRQKR